MKLIDRSGWIYGRWTVLNEFKRTETKTFWMCRCKCGTEKFVDISNLTSGHSTSCGCYWHELNPSKKHGMHSTHVYRLYYGIKRRCYVPNDQSYSRYGGRGITMCSEWLNDNTAFFKWAYENGWAKGLQIDRIDVNGNYEPGNCRFVTPMVNANNKANTITMSYKGTVMSLSDWARKVNIKEVTLRHRVLKLGWSAERALTEPTYHKDKNFCIRGHNLTDENTYFRKDGATICRTCVIGYMKTFKDKHKTA